MADQPLDLTLAEQKTRLALHCFDDSGSQRATPSPHRHRRFDIAVSQHRAVGHPFAEIDDHRRVLRAHIGPGADRCGERFGHYEDFVRTSAAHRDLQRGHFLIARIARRASQSAGPAVAQSLKPAEKMMQDLGGHLDLHHRAVPHCRRRPDTRRGFGKTDGLLNTNTRHRSA